MTTPDRLSEALLGLCLLASQTPREGQERLVAQFRATYPEVVLDGNIAGPRRCLTCLDAANYLDFNRKTNIGHGSILHRELRASGGPRA